MPIIHFIPTDKPEAKDNDYMYSLMFYLIIPLDVLCTKHLLELVFYLQRVNRQILS